MLFAHTLKKKIEIQHGKGSVIFAKPVLDNFVELGGRVIQKEQVLLKA